MRVSYEWLGEYVDTSDLPAREAAELLTMSGTKVESVEEVDLSQIIVGRVLESGISIDDLERELFKKALGQTSGNVSKAARLIGLTRRTLQYRMEKWGISKAATT